MRNTEIRSKVAHEIKVFRLNARMYPVAYADKAWRNGVLNGMRAIGDLIPKD